MVAWAYGTRSSLGLPQCHVPVSPKIASLYTPTPISQLEKARQRQKHSVISSSSDEEAQLEESSAESRSQRQHLKKMSRSPRIVVSSGERQAAEECQSVVIEELEIPTAPTTSQEAESIKTINIASSETI
jgi:hypothetical protein